MIAGSNTGPTWGNIVDLLGALLVWPVAAVVIVLVFRSDLKGLINRLREWEGLGQKFSFEQGLVVAEKAADLSIEGLPPERLDVRMTGDMSLPEGVLVLIDSNPSSAVLKTWDSFEKAVDNALKKVPPSTPSRPAPFPIKMRRLRESGVVTSDWLTAADALRQLRNEVAHGQHVPTRDEALSFVETVHVLNVRLNWGLESHLDNS